MLYCPKCQKSYEDGAQRFCANDGVRLVSPPNAAKGTNDIFTDLIGTVSAAKPEDRFASLPHFAAINAPAAPSVRAANESEDDNLLELELDFEKNPAKQAEPAARIVKQSEVHSGTAEVGNRKTNPAGRAAFTSENPRVLLGQMIKGRYQIVELIKQNEAGISFLAKDQIVADKKVLVRILPDESAGDDLASKILAEERVSLSHINHPNLARVIDSGELLEGNPFIISEFVEADSIRDLLQKNGQLNARRAARIVKQTAYALSEIHQNGILHRDLKPEDILLSVSEAGIEQVKLSNFSTSSGKIHRENLFYQAPEVLAGKNATFAADIYSLGVVAYQMLTGRLPFRGDSVKELLKAQSKGVPVAPTNVRLDLPAAIDQVLEKALNFNPTDRFPKTRDFGDAFFNALSSAVDAPIEMPREPLDIQSPNAPTFEAELELPQLTAQTLPANAFSGETDVLEIERNEAPPKDSAASAAFVAAPTAKTENANFNAATPDALSPESDELLEKAEAKPAGDLWERRSPEPPVTASRSWILFSVVGLALLLGGAWAMWSYSLNRQSEPEIAAPPKTIENQAPLAPVQTIKAETSADVPTNTIETPPPARQISQPPNTTFFQSSKQNLKGDLIRNYLPFSLYYPNGWQLSEVRESTQEGVRGKFLDVSKLTEDGQLSEQMLISYYKSEGTFNDDEQQFPNLVKETNETLKKLIPNYQVFSEGKIKVNGEWKAYEVKFQGGGTAKNGEKLIVWGRRLFIPVARTGFPSGYEITMLATSLAPDVRSVDDVGVKGELATVLATFEPNQNF